jgi:2,4-diaminopentanoate dehydrogenase
MTNLGNPLRVAVFGTGRAGTELVRACRQRADLKVVAGITTTPEKHGADLGTITLGQPLGVEVVSDLDAVLPRGDVDVLLHAGLGTPTEVAAVLGRCAEAGTDAITVSGFIHPPTALGADNAAALHQRAVGGDARIVGTGVNPGFLLDTLPATWATMVSRVDRLSARRVADIRTWGDGVLDSEIGVGRPPADNEDNDRLSVLESVALLNDALCLDVDRSEERYEPVAAPSPREFRGRRVETGQTVGFRRAAIGYRRGTAVLQIEWLGIFCLDPELDGAQEFATVTIDGDDRVESHATGSFLANPYPSTAARAVNAIRPLRTLPPGLYRPDQVPVTRNRE